MNDFLETEEQRKRRVREEADARYARLVRLNEAEAADAQSQVVAAELEQARLRREANERIAAAEERARRAAATSARRAPAPVKRSAGRIEYRAFNEHGQLMRGPEVENRG